MNGKLCAVKCEDIVTVFKLPTESIIATYLIYLFPCIIGIVNCLFKKLLAVERKIFSCKVKGYHKQIRAARVLSEVNYLSYVTL